MAEVVDAYLRYQAGRVKAETLRWLTRFLTPFRERYGRWDAGALRPDVLEQWADRPEWKPNIRVHAVRNVHGAFRWAARQRIIPTNPLAGVEAPPTESRGAEHVITPDEHALLITHAWPEFRPYLEALWLTGARPGHRRGKEARRRIRRRSSRRGAAPHTAPAGSFFRHPYFPPPFFPEPVS